MMRRNTCSRSVSANPSSAIAMSSCRSAPSSVSSSGVRVEADVEDAGVLTQDPRLPRDRHTRRDQPHRQARELRQEIVRGVERDDTACLEHRDAPAQRFGLLEIVCRQYDRVAIAIQLADEPPQALPQLDVDARRRLVQHDHRRLVHQRLPDQHAALHAAGQRAHVGVRLSRQVQVVQDFVDPRAVPAQAEIAGLHFQRFAHAEERIEHQFLRNDAQVAPRKAKIGGDVVPEDARAAAIGPGEAGEDRDECRLAGAVRTQQAEELALLDGQVDAVQGLHAAEAARDILHVDGEHGVKGGGMGGPDSRNGRKKPRGNALNRPAIPRSRRRGQARECREEWT